MSEEKNVQTETKQVEVDLDALLGTPGASTIVTPEDAEKEEKKEKTNIFSPKKDNISAFLDNLGSEEEEEEKKEEEEENKSEPEQKKEEEVKKENQEEKKETKEEIENNEEIKKTRKSANSIFQNLINKGVIIGYEGLDNIEDYSQEDLENLIEDNMNNVSQKIQQGVVNQFYNELPEEFRKAYEYYLDGGTDIKSFLRTVSSVNELKDLSLDKESDQKTIIREYLKSKDWGTAEEIEDEINDIDDRGDLRKKAEKYKPMLDSVQNKILETKLKEQEEKKKAKQLAAKEFERDVKEVLSQQTLNGVEMDQKIRDMIYVGLMDTSYDSVNGTKTNKFGSLLEKYQYGKEKNLSLVAEAFWLLADPKSYKMNVAQTIRKIESNRTMRTLKTEQQAGKSNSSSTMSNPKEENKIPKRNEKKQEARSFFDFSR